MLHKFFIKYLFPLGIGANIQPRGCKLRDKRAFSGVFIHICYILSSYYHLIIENMLIICEFVKKISSMPIKEFEIKCDFERFFLFLKVLS